MKLVITGYFHTRQDFFNQLAAATWGADRPAPTNLDGLADLLHEVGVRTVTVRGTWMIAPEVSRRIAQVCKEMGVALELPH